MNQIPIINDYQKPKLTNTEKAISMLQTEIEMLKQWNFGLQRQIATIALETKITPYQFCLNVRKQDEVNKWLTEVQQIESEMIKKEQEDGQPKAKETS